MVKISKKHYIQGFGISVIVLALVRCATGWGGGVHTLKTTSAEADTAVYAADSLFAENTDSIGDSAMNSVVSDEEKSQITVVEPVASNLSLAEENGKKKYHRILSVPRYAEAFPDSQEVQLKAALKYGVKKVANREDAERRKQELVYIGANPYFHIDRMRRSIPYLVPRASMLLNDIGRQFYDSLYVKGVPLHKIIVTSALRTTEDVEKLRQRNGNATENSCHLYGTTFDICYNRYKTVEDPAGPKRRQVQNDTLKWVLSEVLRDVRESGRCYIKYEVKQGCFHITVR